MKFKEFFAIFTTFCCVFVQGQERENCGRKFSATGQVIGGRKVQSNEWPWLVALIYWPKNKFFCGGNLVSSKHVISGKICRVCD
jgi:secreted trypsin-like serine protease